MRLGNVSKIKTGNLDANAKVEDGRYPFFTCAQKPERIDTFSFDCECVLVAGNGDLNVKYYSGKFDAYQRTYVVEVLKKDLLDTRFLFHFLNKYVDKLRSQSIGGVIKYIKMANLTDIELPDYSLFKQRDIVKILDTADALCQKRKEQLALLDDYLKSVFLDMFGDHSDFKKIKIRDIASTKKYALSSGPFGSNLTSKDYASEGVIVLRGLNVSNGFLNLKQVKYISEEKARDLERSEVVPNDIVIVAVGSSGLALRIPETLPRAIMSQNFNKISPDINVINPVFLQYYINSNFVQEQFRREITDTVRTFLSLTKIKDVEIILPAMEVQNKFVSIVKGVEQTKKQMSASLDEMDNHFNALIQRYFG